MQKKKKKVCICHVLWPLPLLPILLLPSRVSSSEGRLEKLSSSRAGYVSQLCLEKSLLEMFMKCSPNLFTLESKPFPQELLLRWLDEIYMLLQVKKKRQINHSWLSRSFYKLLGQLGVSILCMSRGRRLQAVGSQSLLPQSGKMAEGNEFLLTGPSMSSEASSVFTNHL